MGPRGSPAIIQTRRVGHVDLARVRDKQACQLVVAAIDGDGTVGPQYWAGGNAVQLGQFRPSTSMEYALDAPIWRSFLIFNWAIS